MNTIHLSAHYKLEDPVGRKTERKIQPRISGVELLNTSWEM
jgi:hypothetical protein